MGVPGTRPPFGLYVLGICGVALGLAMIFEGLALRFTGEPLTVFGRANLWIIIPRLFNQPGWRLAWPLTALGCSWLGVVMGVIMGLRWAQRIARLYALISLLYVGIGTILAALVLLMLGLASTRAWLESLSGDGHGEG
jgi:hypothetical protein